LKQKKDKKNHVEQNNVLTRQRVIIGLLFVLPAVALFPLHRRPARL
jgi:hypothetical protein